MREGYRELTQEEAWEWEILRALAQLHTEKVRRTEVEIKLHEVQAKLVDAERRSSVAQVMSVKNKVAEFSKKVGVVNEGDLIQDDSKWYVKIQQPAAKVS